MSTNHPHTHVQDSYNFQPTAFVPTSAFRTSTRTTQDRARNTTDARYEMSVSMKTAFRCIRENDNGLSVFLKSSLGLIFTTEDFIFAITVLTDLRKKTTGLLSELKFVQCNFFFQLLFETLIH